MSLSDQINLDLKEAMLARDEVRKRTLRSVKTALQNALVEKRGAAGRDTALDDQEALAVIDKQAKQRRDAIEEFGKAGRMDLVQAEEAELAVLESYLPRQLSEAEIRVIVQQVIDETGASGPQDIGRVMRPAMDRLQGSADGRQVNQIARALLTSL